MKEKILAALKLKYSTLGFVEADFEGVANFLVSTVTEDSQIETAVSGVEPLLKTFQSASDRKTTTLKTELDALKLKHPETIDPTIDPAKKEEPKPGDDVNKTLLEAIQSLKDEIAGIKSGNASLDRKAALELKLKDVDPLIKNPILTNFEFVKGLDDEKYAEWVTANTAGIEASVKTLNEKKLSDMPKVDLLEGLGKDGKKSDFQTLMKEATATELDKKAKA